MMSNFIKLNSGIMANWADLPLEMAITIATMLDFNEDLMAFGGVCSCWRRARKLVNHDIKSTRRQIPWLMLAAPPRTAKRKLYSLYNHMVLQVDLPAPSVRRPAGEGENPLFPQVGYKKESDWRYFSSRGWLICVTQIGLQMSLVHPISGHTIHIPSLPDNALHFRSEYEYKAWHDYLYLTFPKKFALSHCPSTTSDYTLAMIYGGIDQGMLALWRSRDEEWTIIPHQHYRCTLTDVTYYKGQFIAVTMNRYFYSLSLDWETNPPIPRNFGHLRNYCVKRSQFTLPYLVESDGQLLAVFRHVDRRFVKGDDCFIDYETTHFRVWDVKVDTGEFIEIEYNLGNKALFLGWNSSFSVHVPPCSAPAQRRGHGYFVRNCIDYADKVPPLSAQRRGHGYFIRNCIYYADDNCLARNSIYYADDLLPMYFLQKGGRDMGVYCLGSSNKDEGAYYDGPSRFSLSTPPLWVETLPPMIPQPIPS